MGEVKDEFGFFYEEAKDYINSIEKFIKKFEDASQQNHPKVQKYLERFTAKIFHNQQTAKKDFESGRNIQEEIQQRKRRVSTLKEAEQFEKNMNERSITNKEFLKTNLNKIQQLNNRTEERIQDKTSEIQHKFRELQADFNKEDWYEVDKEKQQIRIKIQKGEKVQVVVVTFRSKENKFVIISSNSEVVQAGLAFNFHRNLAKLYDELYILI